MVRGDSKSLSVYKMENLLFTVIGSVELRRHPSVMMYDHSIGARAELFIGHFVKSVPVPAAGKVMDKSALHKVARGVFVTFFAAVR